MDSPPVFSGIAERDAACLRRMEPDNALVRLIDAGYRPSAGGVWDILRLHGKAFIPFVAALFRR